MEALMEESHVLRVVLAHISYLRILDLVWFVTRMALAVADHFLVLVMLALVVATMVLNVSAVLQVSSHSLIQMFVKCVHLGCT